jgi:hypothetical protein
MAQTFHFFDLIAISLAAPSVAFMVWVFWNLTLQIKREVRTKVVPPETTWAAQTASNREPTRERAFVGTEGCLLTPDRLSAISRPGAATFERRFASRVR